MRRAKTALSECSRIDECQEWADKARALASYAKQSKDDSLRKMAERIQSRAINRCGELLKQVDGRGNNQHSVGAHTTLSQRQAAKDANLSKHQQVQAVRVANIPRDQFESLVESDNPPTVTKLAEMGKRQARPEDQPWNPGALPWRLPLSPECILPAAGGAAGQRLTTKEKARTEARACSVSNRVQPESSRRPVLPRAGWTPVGHA